MKQVCIRLDDEVYKKLRVWCFTRGVTMTSALQGVINSLFLLDPLLKSESKVDKPSKPAVTPKPFDNTNLSKSYQTRKVKK